MIVLRPGADAIPLHPACLGEHPARRKACAGFRILMIPTLHRTTLPTSFHPLRLPLPAFPVRLARPDPQGLSRRELRALVAEMLG